MSDQTRGSANIADHFFSARQLAARYDVSVPTIWRWRRTGVLPDGIRLSGGRTRWPSGVIREWEASRPTVGEHPFPSAAQKKTPNPSGAAAADKAIEGGR